MQCRHLITCSMWPVSVRRSWPLAVSQILIVRSAADTGRREETSRRHEVNKTGHATLFNAV